MKNKKYYPNKARCNHCGDIVISTHRHDFVSCKCFKSSDGKTGFFLDGGDDYWRCGGNLSNMERI
jgi:hypothetical protein